MLIYSKISITLMKYIFKLCCKLNKPQVIRQELFPSMTMTKWYNHILYSCSFQNVSAYPKWMELNVSENQDFIIFNNALYKKPVIINISLLITLIYRVQPVVYNNRLYLYTSNNEIPKYLIIWLNTLHIIFLSRTQRGTLIS